MQAEEVVEEEPRARASSEIAGVHCFIGYPTTTSVAFLSHIIRFDRKTFLLLCCILVC